jgi:lysophospholipase L1-like esterase
MERSPRPATPRRWTAVVVALAGFAVIGVTVDARAADAPTVVVAAADRAASTAATAPPADAAAADAPVVSVAPFLPSVVVVGDSLTVGIEPYFAALLPDRAGRVAVDARVGRPTSEGLTVLSRQKVEPGAIVVLALGTNDGADRAAFARRIDEGMALATGASTVIWFTIWRGGPVEPLNAALAAAAARYPTMRIVDWAGAVAAHREWMARDGVHSSPTGYRARAAMLAAAVESCCVVSSDR